MQEHYKKTNFPYPLKREPAGGSTTSAQKHHLPASAAMDSLSKELREQSGPFANFHPNQGGQSCLGAYSWPGSVAASTATSDIVSSKAYGSPNGQMCAETQYPLHHDGYDNNYNHGHYLGEQYPPAGPYSGSQMSSEFTHRPHSQDWQQHQYWQDPHLQHPPFTFPPQRNNSHPISSHITHPSMAYASHPVVYVPVPLPISEAVTKYVNDFHRYEQQQRFSDPSSHVTPPVPHREPIFAQQPTPFPSFAAAAAGAPELSSSGEPVSASGPAAPLLYGAAAHLDHLSGGVRNEENGSVALTQHASLKRAREESPEAPIQNGVNGAACDSPGGQEVASASQEEQEGQEEQEEHSDDDSLDSDASFEDDDDEDADEQQ